MAVSHCIRVCQHCGSAFHRTAKNQPIKYCSTECKSRHSAEANRAYYRNNIDYFRSREAERVRANRPPRRRSFVTYHCDYCGTEFSKREDNGRLYCRKSCRDSAVKERAIEAKAVRDAVLSEARSLRRIRRRVIRYFKGLAKGKSCQSCESKITGKARYCPPCGRRRAEDNRKRCRRIYKAKRRAVERGANADHIDPIAVFMRDGWKCQLCGRSTPKRLRGSYKDNAPELDHVVPLAANGQHKWGNVQCACRRCNIQKSDRPMGQIGFDIAV